VDRLANTKPGGGGLSSGKTTGQPPAFPHYRLGVDTVLENRDRAHASVIVAAKRSRQISP
jgi:hypothetical protein